MSWKSKNRSLFESNDIENKLNVVFDCPFYWYLCNIFKFSKIKTDIHKDLLAVNTLNIQIILQFLGESPLSG